MTITRNGPGFLSGTHCLESEGAACNGNVTISAVTLDRTVTGLKYSSRPGDTSGVIWFNNKGQAIIFAGELLRVFNNLPAIPPIKVAGTFASTTSFELWVTEHEHPAAIRKIIIGWKDGSSARGSGGEWILNDRSGAAALAGQLLEHVSMLIGEFDPRLEAC